MKVRSVFILAVFLFIGSACYSQVLFSERPTDYRLYPRLGNDSSTVTIAGLVNDSSYHTVIFTMYKNDVLIDSISDSLYFMGDNASFNHEFSIHAERSNYRFSMFIYDDTTHEVYTADNICSGDVYLIYGQSNAVAATNGQGNDPTHQWVRSFGSENYDDSVCFADTSWGLGIGNSYNSHMSIGVWAMRLGQIIADSSGIPVCFINGSHNGCRIATNLPSTDHADVHSIYGRLLCRTQKAEVAQRIKGIFWYQGESDTDTASLEYANRFNVLYNAWLQDFPGFSKVYIIQIRPGCILTANPVYHQIIRDIQRALSETDLLIELVPTVGLPFFDGCHFSAPGYKILAQLIYNMLSEEIYDHHKPSSSVPPKIKQVLYTGNDNTVLSIVFDQQVLWPSTFNGFDLKDYIYLNSSATIVSGWSTNDTINLQLSASTNADKITYLPGIYYAGTTDPYLGPWLLNGKGYGVPSFYELPVKNTLLLNASSNVLKCRGDSILLSANALNQSAQWYLNGNPIVGETNNSYLVKSAGDYYLMLTDADSLIRASNTISVTHEIPPVPTVTTLGGQFSFCNGSLITLQCNVTAGSYQWYRDGIKINNATAANFNTSIPGNYAVVVQHLNSCMEPSASQTVTRHSLPSTSIVVTNQFDNCYDTLVTLTTNGATGNTYQWRNNQIAIPAANRNIYGTKKAGAYSVTITNSEGCSYTSGYSNIPMTHLFASYITSGPANICIGKSVTFTAAGGSGYMYQWLKNNLPISGAKSQYYHATTSGNYGLKIINAMGCLSSAPATAITSSNCEILRKANEENADLKVFPNPFSDQLFVQLLQGNEPIENFSLELFDINGHVVLKTEGDEGGVSDFKISTKTLTKGLYFYRVNVNGSYFNGKALKQ